MYNAVKTAALILGAPKAAGYPEKDKGRAGKVANWVKKMVEHDRRKWRKLVQAVNHRQSGGRAQAKVKRVPENTKKGRYPN